MAEHDMSVVVSELNKLKKNELIDLITSFKLPNSATNSHLINYVKNLKKLDSGNEFFDGVDTLTVSKSNQCNNNECLRIKTEVKYIRSELETVSKLTSHLEKRTQEQEDLIFLLKKSSSAFSVEDAPSVNTKIIHKELINAANSNDINASRFCEQKTVDDTGEEKRKLHSEDNAAKSSRFKEHNKNNRNSKTNGNSQSGKRVNKSPKPVIGMYDSNNVKSVLKKGYLHVYRLQSSTTEVDLLNLLKTTAPHINFECELLNKNDKTCSFKLSFPLNLVKDVYKAEIWPKGAAVKRFFFKKTSNFAEDLNHQQKT